MGLEMIIVLSSGLHGSGRSYVADHLAEFLKEKGYTAARISSGDIFREIAKKKGFSSIEDFIKYLKENPEEARKVDVNVDKLMMKKIREFSKKCEFVIVDSNLAPFYSKNLGKAVNIFIYTKPEIIAKRVFERRREMDKEYENIEEVIQELIKRTERDIKRYRELSKSVDDKKLEKIYRIGSEIMEIALDYCLSNGKIPERLKEYFDAFIDNNGPVEETVMKIWEYLKDMMSEESGEKK